MDLLRLPYFYDNNYLGEKTDKLIGVSETLLMTAIGGIIFAILSGQPLVIVGVTGPTLVFEESLYQVGEVALFLI